MECDTCKVRPAEYKVTRLRTSKTKLLCELCFMKILKKKVTPKEKLHTPRYN